MTTLQQLYTTFDACKRCKTQKNPLKHILGGGKTKNPRFLFLFINPTHKNISSYSNYEGSRRYPFIGVRHFYKLLSSAGFVDKIIIGNIYNNGWKTEDEKRIENSLIKNDVYLTNLVKCTQPHPENPTKDIIIQDLPLLYKEIDIVKPTYIVTFGKLTYQTLTNQDIRLKDKLEEVKKGTYQPDKSLNIINETYPILPCYFPVGRGNPPKALQILSYIKKQFA